MSHLRNKGLLFAASALAIAGCSSPKEPFAQKFERPQEQCFSASEFARMGGDRNSGDLLASNDQAFINGFPAQYVVRKGDTLWGIAGRFLKKPWYWRQIWYSNPQIKNPNLIYPGDVLRVVNIGGKPYLTISEAHNPYHGTATGRHTRDGRPVVRYEPGMADPNLPGAAPRLSDSVLFPFLQRTRILSLGQLQQSPTIFGNDNEYVTLSQQNEIFAQGVRAPRGTKLWIYERGEPVVDFDYERKMRYVEDYEGPTVLGQQMNYVGEAVVVDYDPIHNLTRLQPLNAASTVKEGDILLPPEQEVAPIEYFPRMPSMQCKRGYILNNTNQNSLNIKEYDSVVTSFGEVDGAHIGDIWAIERPGKMRVINGQPVALPGETVGFLMIYKVYEKVSLGVVLDSTRPIAATDYLVRP